MERPEGSKLNGSRILYTRTLEPRPVPVPNSPDVWGLNYTTDHMLTCTWTSHAGWAVPIIKPYENLVLNPIASVLHYGTECFEGMKAYRGHDGKLRLFRPERNCARMLASANRVALPGFEAAELQALIEKFVGFEGPRWLPRDQGGCFLYIRPTLIGTAERLGPYASNKALLFIIAVCFPEFDRPSSAPTSGMSLNKAGMRLIASRKEIVRAWPGGFGNCKVGANYGPSFAAQQEAKTAGYDQILYLFGEEDYVTEAGASNFFVLWRNTCQQLELITAPLEDGIILAGVVRQSVLDLVRELLSDEIAVVERRYTMKEVLEAADEGRLVEAFASGTGYGIAPAATIKYQDKDILLPLAQGRPADWARRIGHLLKDIMYGVVQHEWGVVVPEQQEQPAQSSTAGVKAAPMAVVSCTSIVVDS